VAALLERLHDSTRPPLWLDDTAYSTRLFGHDPESWLDVGGVIAFRRKAVALLRPDVIVLPVDVVVSALMRKNPELLMGVKMRAIAPLRRLLADQDLRGVLVDLAHALRSAFPASTLALVMPSPRRWVGDAYRAAFGDSSDITVGQEETDSSAVYVAEFLSSFGDAGADCVLLVESADSEPTSAAEIGWYQPVINLAKHYRWDLGIYLPTADSFSGEVSGVDFVVAPRALAGVPAGAITPLEFWAGADARAVPPGGFRFARIPPDAIPEQVLERLTVLRQHQ
jgi:hypothetical protein